MGRHHENSKVQNAKDFVYTGRDNLEAMAEARNYNRFLIKLVKDTMPDPKAKILDFGAGSGTYADMLLEQGVRVNCLEPDRTLQNTLKGKGYKVTSTADDLKTGSYDLIYALNVFEHIDDDFGNFATLKEALKKDGRLLIYVPAFQSLFSSMDKLVGHHRRYRKSRLQNMAEVNGMQVISINYHDPIGFLAALVFKVSGNKNGVLSPLSVRIYDRFAYPVSRLLEPLTRHLFGKNVAMVVQKNGQ